MLGSKQELEGKINEFMRRKREQYPELSDPTAHISPRS
jgi:hypothetical protein